MVPFILGLYVATLMGLAFFGAHRLKMLWLYFRSRRVGGGITGGKGDELVLGGGHPQVCVQCPVFNEPLMIEALLEKVTALDWPAEQLEVQVLDDSTDETPEVVARWLAAHPVQAKCVRHVRRANRLGYKAGALAHGMTLTDAPFFAVFDADFRPAPDFLTATMPRFAEARVGVVQARWEFANRNASLLTRFQAVFLDAHFVIEQAARAAAGLFFNFNGTAGVWRREALEAAGGWTADTVTEDLDASYRAQLAGWRFVYLDDYAVPSELPENLIAFKSQQRRWTKGGIQVARKLLRTILTSNKPGRIKREAFCHLTVGLVHPLLVTFSLLFVPCLYLIGGELTGPRLWLNPVVVLMAGGTSVAFYVTGQFFRRRAWGEGLLWLVASPLVLSFGLAMSVTCCVAVIEGLVTRGGEFVRTPKGGRGIAVASLVQRMRSRSLFIAIMLAELALGTAMMVGAVHFHGLDQDYIASVLVVKSLGFLGIAALTSSDLWPWPVSVRA